MIKKLTTVRNYVCLYPSLQTRKFKVAFKTTGGEMEI